MNYKKIYEDFILSRKLLDRKKGNGVYLEKHHIIPRCIEGCTNDKSNLVNLTFREHYFAHALLTKIYTGKNKWSLYTALGSMVVLQNNSNHRTAGKLTLGQIEYAKKLMAEATSVRMTGSKLSDEWKNNISKGNKGKNSGRVQTEEEKKIRSDGGKGIKKSPETKERMRQYSLNRTDEHKQHRSEAQMIAVLQFDLVGKFIKEWTSQQEAAKELRIDQSNIGHALSGRNHTAFNSIWKYKSDFDTIPEQIEVIDNRKVKDNKGKAIVQYDLNMNFITEYVSANQAGQKSGVSYLKIWKCIKGERDNADGFIFRYKEALD